MIKCKAAGECEGGKREERGRKEGKGGIRDG